MSRLSHKIQSNKRKKNLALVCNTLDLEDNIQPLSAGNLPIGMREDESNTLSANFGTDRPLQGGKCYTSSDNLSGVFIGAAGLFESTPISFGCWVKLDNDTQSRNILGKGSDTFVSSWGTSIYASGGNLYAKAAKSDLGYKSAPYEYTIGEWTHIYFTLSNLGPLSLDPVIGDARFYINGELFDEQLGVDIYNVGYSWSWIAAWGNISSPQSSITGSSFDARIFERELSAEDIKNLYQFKTLGDEWCFYKGDSQSTTDVYDSSGNDRHKTIVNYYSGFLDTQNEYSWLDEVGYTLSDGITYYYDQALTQLITSGEFIPKLESVTTPPFKCAAYVTGGVRGDLQYIGKAPSRAKFKEANCFAGDGAGYFLLDSQINTVVGDKIEIEVSVVTAISSQFMFLGRSDSLSGYFFINPAQGSTDSLDWRFNNQKCVIAAGSPLISSYLLACTNNEPFTIKGIYQNGIGTWVFENLITGETISDSMNVTGTESNSYFDRVGGRSGETYNLASTDRIWDIKIAINDVALPRYTFSEYIEAPSTHTAYDVSGNGNHASLVNGSTANRGLQDEFFYDQLGINYRAYVLNRSDYSEVGFFPSDSEERFDITFYCRDEYAQSSYLIDSRGQVNWLGYIYATSGGALSLSMTRDDILVDGISSLTFPRDTNYHRVEIKGVRFFTTNEVVLRLFGHNQSGTVNESFDRIADFEMKSQLTGDTIFNFQNSIDTLTGFDQIVREGFHLPALASDITKDALGNTITLPQDGKSFLNTGTKLAAVTTPRLVQAEQINRFFTDVSDNIINKNHTDFTGAETGDQDFNDISSTDEVTNIRKHNSPLTGIQLITEKTITNN